MAKKVKTVKNKKNEWLLFYKEGSDKCYYLKGLGDTVMPDTLKTLSFTKKKDGEDEMVELGLTQIEIF